VEKNIEGVNLFLPSKIWQEFSQMPFNEDIAKSVSWIKATLNEYPGAKGIYLGLDTLNMNGGDGENIEIGLNTKCDPKVLDNEFSFDCDHYGQRHLIRGLFEVSENFDSEKWNREESRQAEYFIFLCYSGLVLREALIQANIQNDFISLWGFHDGDMFFLMQKIGDSTLILPSLSAF
jgi:hypothetical protein